MKNKKGSGIVTIVIVLAVICVVFLAAGFSLMVAWNGGWNFWRNIPDTIRNVEEFNIDQTQEHEVAGVEKFEFATVSADMKVVFAETDTVKAELKGSYRSSRGMVELKMQEIGNTVRIYVDYPKTLGAFNWNSTVLTVTMPRDMEQRDISFSTVSGDLDIPEGLEAGKIRVNSTSGNVRASNVNINNFQYGNVSGKLDMTGSIRDEIRVDTVSGNTDIRLNDELDMIFVSSVSGHVDIHLDDKNDFSFSFSTVSGNLNCEFPIFESGTRNNRKGFTDEEATMEFDINTVSGDLRIRKK